MEELIKKYCESQEFVSYKELPELFGLTITNIVELLSKTIEIYDKGFTIYDNDYKPIYKTEISDWGNDQEFWVKYDSLGRVVSNKEGNTRIEEYKYDDKNRLKIIETHNDIRTYEYDSEGNPTYTTIRKTE